MKANTPPAVALAIGRIFRMAARPEQPGDAAEYERCRRIILDNSPEPEETSHCYVRDRLRGAQGD